MIEPSLGGIDQLFWKDSIDDRKVAETPAAQNEFHISSDALCIQILKQPARANSGGQLELNLFEDQGMPNNGQFCKDEVQTQNNNRAQSSYRFFLNDLKRPTSPKSEGHETSIKQRSFKPNHHENVN